MKQVRMIMIAGIIAASVQFAEAAPATAGPAENFFQIRRPPPPPDPLHLFSRHPRRRRTVRHARRRSSIRLPHIKLPPPPPRP